MFLLYKTVNLFIVIGFVVFCYQPTVAIAINKILIYAVLVNKEIS